MFGASKTKQVSSAANYIEDVFSTWLYTGNSSTQTITNGIDLATNGGAVFFGGRNVGTNKSVYDTARGATYDICTNLTQQQIARTTALTGFTTSGFTLGADAATEAVNLSGTNYVSWTFRKQPKFFDVVTYTGTGSVQNIAHNLGSTPGCIIVKRTDTTSNWQVYHNGLTSAAYSIQLNLTNAQASATTVWNSTAPTSTVFSVGTDATVNASGGTYVAYIFAHNAGGFGLTGTDNVISCGSFTCDGSGAASINLGYEPQYILVKRSNTTGDWAILDTMRGLYSPSTVPKELDANTSSAETNGFNWYINATGFTIDSVGAGNQFIYIAIRRGPMKVPTDGTKVFSPNIGNNVSGSGLIANAGFPVDAHFEAYKNTTGRFWFDRLRGDYYYLSTASTAAETAAGQRQFANMSGAFFTGTFNFSTAAVYDFRRAPSFFDEVCYTGTGSNMTVAHNLGVAPELMIVKVRNNNVWDWCVYAAPLGATKYLQLNLTTASGNAPTVWNNTAPTSSVFTVGTASDVNASSAYNYVAYLFATCTGVSKVGSYTGNGSTQTINCGFTGGARFVLIKRTDSTGGWYVYDTARGMTTLTDPYLLLNSTAAETATLGSVTTVTTGFAVNASILAAINTNGASYIFLAIA